jgi:Flp pilus assembly protein TadD
VELADDAVRAAPWEAEPHAVQARAERRLGSLHRALEDAQAAVERESLEPEHRLLVAEIEADPGHPDAADAALDRAFSLSPRSPRFRRDEVARLEDRIAELRASGS